MNTSKDKITPPDSFIIYSGLYNWYMQQDLSLDHKSKHRLHFCLLVFIQSYLEDNLTEHSQDSSAVAIADIYKRDMKCDSASFNELFNSYFDKAIEGNHHYSLDFYANGYKLKDAHLDGIFYFLIKEFENTNKLSYCKIEHNIYQETTLYKMSDGLFTRKKGEALESNNLSRKNEDKLERVERNILKDTSYKIEENTSFHLPNGYGKYPLTINIEYLKEQIKNTSIDKRERLFYIGLVTINSVYPFAVYKTLSTGRLQTTSNINKRFHPVLKNYQGIKKLHRKNIFKGMYEYDISTSAPTILLQLYKKDFPKAKTLTYIEDYINNKQKRREEWAFLIDEEDSISRVKSVLTAMFFGANIKKFRSNALNNEMSDKSFKILLNDEPFLALVNDVDKLFSALAKKYCQRRNGLKYYVADNLVGINKKFTLKDKKKAIAHIYQGIEVTILKAIYRKYQDSICLMIHDAIITKDKLDPQELSEIAFDKTGYEVTYEESIF
jgi:hypothetical protein